jgi:hypothetical protein
MPELRSSDRRIAGGEFAPDIRLGRKHGPPLHPCARQNKLGIKVVQRAVLIVCFQSALATADSYTPLWKNVATPNCRASMTRSCDLKQDLSFGPISHWNSSLRLNAGGEGIQLQISRAVWAEIRQESARGPLVLLPVARTATFENQSQFSRSDRLEKFLLRIVRKVFLSDHPWRRKTPPRCRNKNAGAPGCD